MSKADIDARKVIEQMPNLSEPERQYLQTVARGEGFYGLGWGNPSKLTIETSAKFGLTGFEGKGSRNWGADQGKGTAGSFPHVDFGWRDPADPKKPWKRAGPRVWGPYVAQYAKYHTDLESATRVARILLRDNVRAALARGSLREAVFAQHANGYFELDPEKYLQAVLSNYGKIIAATGLKPLLSEHGDGGPLSEADLAPQTVGSKDS